MVANVVVVVVAVVVVVVVVVVVEVGVVEVVDRVVLRVVVNALNKTIKLFNTLREDTHFLFFIGRTTKMGEETHLTTKQKTTFFYDDQDLMKNKKN